MKSENRQMENERGIRNEDKEVKIKIKDRLRVQLVYNLQTIQIRKNKMQWKFRKVLESLDNYRNNSQSFIAEVEKGTSGVLNTLIRQIDHILAAPDEKIITKVLAMRFAKDIMILGRSDVVSALTKIVPQILKICSHRLEDDSPDRGQNFFNNHSAYIKGTEEERREIQSYASTYFILTLQSILHWAKWVPADENGNQSIYLKGYNSLKERGVKFENSFHYYKQSDYERFNNTYRVQFFTETSFMNNASNNMSMMTSRIENEELSEEKKSIKSQSSRVSEKELASVQKMKNVVHELSFDRAQHPNKLREMNRKLQQIFLVNYSNQQKKFHGIEKEEKRWIQNYLINYTLLKSNLISYNEFMKKMTTEVINLSIQEENIPEDTFKKQKKSAKKEIVEKSKEKEMYENLLKKQENQYEGKISNLLKEREANQKKIQKMKKHFQEEKAYITNEYESRLKLIKKGMTEDSGDKTQYLIRENEKLRERLNDFERSFKDNERERQLESERNKLYRDTELLKIQNERLKALNPDLIAKIKLLEQQLTNKSYSEKSFEEVSYKKNNDQVNLYKMQLSNERDKNTKKIKNFQKKILQLQFTNKELIEQNSNLKRKLSLKELQTDELGEQVRLYKVFDKEGVLNVGEQPKQKEKSFKYKKYEGLKNSYKGNKELFLRFCRCCLKKKDILMKENELEVGLITEVISQVQMRFIVHFTNMSNTQFQNIEISIERPSYVEAEMSTTFIFCIQRQEQQKVTIKCKSSCQLSSITLYEPVVLSVTYGKNKEVFTQQLNLPFLAFKVLEFYKPESKNIGRMLAEKKESIGVYYSKKMIPKVKYIKNLFSHLEETSSTIYQCEVYHRVQKFLMRICFQFTGESFAIIEMIPIKEEPLTKKEHEALLDLAAFMEFAFRK